jgi:hypothetical protein
MKKTVQIVTIPLDKEGWSKGDIINDGKFTSIGIYSSEGFGNWQPQQLLVLSDDEVELGDIGKIVKYPFGIGKTIEHGGNHGIEVECITCTLVDNIYNVVAGTKGRFSSEDVYEILASYPQIPGTLPISKETVQIWIDSGTPEEGSVEVVDWNCLRPDICKCYNQQKFYPYCKYYKDSNGTKLDPQGNLLLKFGKNIELKEIGEKLKDRILFPDALEHAKDYLSKVVKPSIPTDEEIDRICVRGCHDFILEKGIMTPITPKQYYTAGYKQALKDLGHKN